MLEAMNMLWITLGVVALAGAGGLLLLMWRLRRQAQLLSQAQQQIDALSANLSALCSGAVGVDKRVARLERNNRDLKFRQETFESHGQVSHAYGDAIKLVRQGASAHRLVEELGLSRSEADLVVMLHGLKEAS
jgi:hypothetical protein